MGKAIYLIGFIVFLAGLVWAAVIVGVPTLYIGIGAVVVTAIGAFGASRLLANVPPGD